MGSDENSGRIDLEALIAETDSRMRPRPEAAPPPLDDLVCDPLATVPEDVRLLGLRNDAPHLDEEPSRDEPPRDSQSTRRVIAFAAGALTAALVASVVTYVLPRAAASPSATTEKTNAVVMPMNATLTPGAHRAAAASTLGSRLGGSELRAAASPVPDRPITLTQRPTPANVTAPTEVTKKPAAEPAAAPPEPAPQPVAEVTPTPAQPETTPTPEPEAPAPTAAAAPTARSLGEAIDEAAGARTRAATKGDGRTAGPDRPALGAIVSALRAVQPEARACLGPDATTRSGRVVFASDGTVASVELAGSTPEDACIRSALSKATVPPFLEPTFSTPVTVRP